MKLFGHDNAISEFRAAMKSAKLHHAWLLTGPHGVGKRTFAEMAALRVLAEAAGPPVDAPDLSVPATHPSAALFHANSHPDFRRLERLPKDDKEAAKPRIEWAADGERARSVKIAQVRSLQGFFATTASLSDHRVVVIDAIDDLERPAANALLKNLEEPPLHTLFFLVCHSPGRLLPTIRSRCRTLQFARLNDEAMTSALRAADETLGSAELAALVSASKGSPGQALRYAGLDIAGMEQQLQTLVTRGDSGNQLGAQLAKDLGKKTAQARYELFLERAPSFVARHARLQQGAEMARSLAIWEQTRDLAGRAQIAALDPSATVFTLAGMVASLHEAAHAQR